MFLFDSRVPRIGTELSFLCSRISECRETVPKTFTTLLNFRLSRMPLISIETFASFFYIFECQNRHRKFPLNKFLIIDLIFNSLEWPLIGTEFFLVLQQVYFPDL